MTSLLKTILEIPLSVIMEVCEQTAAFGYCKYGLHIIFPSDQHMGPSKKVYVLWSCLLLVLLSDFLTCCFQKWTRNSSNIFSFL